MSDLQPKPTIINLGGKEYGLLFTINVIDAVQDKFDIAISQLADLMRDDRKTFKVLRFLLAEMINEAIDDAGNGEKHVDERAVLIEIATHQTVSNLQSLVGAFGTKIHLISICSKIQDNPIRLMAMDNTIRA